VLSAGWARLRPSGADQIALHLGKSSEYREHQASGAGAGVGARFRQGSERPGVHDSLDDAEEVEGLRASRSILRHHTAGASLPSMRLSSRWSAHAPFSR
jgi:hypothetical protein